MAVKVFQHQLLTVHPDDNMSTDWTETYIAINIPDIKGH